jgi:hypothetical protein
METRQGAVRQDREADTVNELKNEKGAVKVVLTLALLALGVYVGLQFGAPYYKYSVFKSDAKEAARVGLGDVERTRTMLFERAQELKLPLQEEDISVAVVNKAVHVSTSWSETVELFGAYQKELNFTVDIEE